MLEDMMILLADRREEIEDENERRGSLEEKRKKGRIVVAKSQLWFYIWGPDARATCEIATPPT